MPYYHDSFMQGKEEFKKIGTYFGRYFAEDVADGYRKPDGFYDVIVTYSGTKLEEFDFYSVWIKEIPLKDRLLKTGGDL